MQLPVCCQCLNPLPAAASKSHRSYWQTVREPGRESEIGEQEQQAERGRDTRDRDEEQVRQRLVVREEKKRNQRAKEQDKRKGSKNNWWEKRTHKSKDAEMCFKEKRGKWTTVSEGHLSVLFGHRRRFMFSRWGWKNTARALVAHVSPDVFVRPPGSRRLQLWMQLAVRWGRCGRQHQSLQRRDLCLQDVNLGVRHRTYRGKDRKMMMGEKSVASTKHYLCLLVNKILFPAAYFKTNQRWIHE